MEKQDTEGLMENSEITLEQAKKMIDNLRQSYEDLEYRYFDLVIESAKKIPYPTSSKVQN